MLCITYVSRSAMKNINFSEIFEMGFSDNDNKNKYTQ